MTPVMDELDFGNGVAVGGFAGAEAVAGQRFASPWLPL
jgi:hypothetical protein